MCQFMMLVYKFVQMLKIVIHCSYTCSKSVSQEFMIISLSKCHSMIQSLAWASIMLDRKYLKHIGHWTASVAELKAAEFDCGCM